MPVTCVYKSSSTAPEPISSREKARIKAPAYCFPYTLPTIAHLESSNDVHTLFSSCTLPITTRVGSPRDIHALHTS